MIVAKPGWDRHGPLQGQTIYVLMKDGEPVGACLRYTHAVAAMENADDIKEVYWLG